VSFPLCGTSQARQFSPSALQTTHAVVFFSKVVELIGVIIVFKMSFVESIPKKEILRFCKRWQVRELALFGSALRADFKPESDVDVLVSFNGTANWGLFDHVQMRLDLDAIFKRKVDLVTRRALEQTQNGLLRERILKTAKVIFADNEAVYAEG
jgi:predicted nucleotidyltransferase